MARFRFRPFRGDLNPKPRQESRAKRRLEVERLQDRILPASTSFSGGVLTIAYSAVNEAVTVTNTSGSIALSGATFTGSGAGAFTGVNRIVATDSGSLAGQSLTFTGTAYTLTGGLNSTGVETVTFSQSINVSGGTSALSVDAPKNIVVNAGLTSGSGGISLTANSSGTSSGNFPGIDVNGATINSGSGVLSLTGKGGASPSVGGLSHGVYLHAASQVISTGGNIIVNGTGSTNSLNDIAGVRVEGGSQIVAGGAGTVNVTGQGGSGSGSYSCYGVKIFGTNSLISSSNGAVSVTGSGGLSGTNGFNYGVVLTSLGRISAGGSGTVTVSGTGGGGSGANNAGVYTTNDASYITSSGGNIQVTGVNGVGTGFGSGGLFLDGNGIISFGGAAVTLIGDSFIANRTLTVNGLSNPVSVQARTAGTFINLGAADTMTGSPLTLGLDDFDLDSITTSILQIGNATSGAMTVSTDVTRPASTNLTLVSGGDIVVSGGLVNTNGGLLVLTPGSTGSVKPTKTGVDLIANTVSFTSGSDLTVNITGKTLDTQFTQLNVTGAVDLSGVDLVLTGAYTFGASDVLPIVSATTCTGTFNGLLENATLTFGAQTLQINYTGTGATLRLAAATTTSVSSTPASPIIQGTSTTFKATITGTPSVGTVTFYAGPGLTNPIGSAVNVGAGSATSSATTSLAVGSYTITAAYSGGTGFAGSLGTMSFVVNAPIAVSPTTLPNWTANASGYSQTITSTGGSGAKTLSITAGAIPTGMTFTAATGVLNGTPTAAGTYNFTVTATDTVGATGSQAYTVVINGAVAVSPTTLPNWTVNTAGYSQTITSSGGTGARTLSVSAGAIPTGMTFTAATGVLNGTPTAAGTYNFTITATDTVGATASQAYTVVINSVVAVTPTTLPNWTMSASGYSQTITSSGGTGAKTLSITAGAVPTGMTFTPATGVLSGTPSAIGTYNFTVTATDTVGATGSRAYTVVIGATTTVSDWGYNIVGQLGNNSGADSSVPVQAIGLVGVTAVSGGGYHTVALKSDGTVWDWGWNSFGQLGNNTTTSNYVPLQVPGLSGVTAIAGGGDHTVALKSDGTVWDWGLNSDGQLGNNSTTNSSVPVQVSGLSGVTAIAAGDGFTAALKSDGTVWDWGSNFNGQLGNNSNTSSSVPVQVSGLTGVASIAAGSSHVVALKSDGTVWGWGANFYGQLGNNTTSDSKVAVQVSGLSGVTAVAGGGFHTVALKSDATVWDWGRNTNGQLGNSTTTNSSVPIQVPGLSGVTAVAAGYSFTVALKSDGTMREWGANTNGQLGNSSTTDSSVPVQVSGLSGVTAIAGAANHTVAIVPSTVTVSSSSIALGATTTGVASTPAQTFTVNGSGLTANLIVTALPGVEISTTAGSGYGSAVTVTPSSGIVNATTIYARISAAASAGSISGNITVASVGAVTKNVSVSGTVNAAVAVSPTTLPNWTTNTAGYSQTITSSGGTGAKTLSITAGAIPTGMTFTAATGVLNGTPSAAGTYNFTVRATDSVGATGSQAYTIVVNGAVAVSPTTLPNWTVNTSGYSQTITSSGGTGARTLSITAGAIPTGMTFTAATGVLNGTPTATGTFNFTITATDTINATGSQAYTVVIAATPTVTGLSPSTGPAAGGTSIVVTGTNFTGATAVKFGATNATTYTVNSATQITATAPAGTGVVDLTVTVPVGGTSATSSADQYTYVALPTVTGLSPSTGPAAGGTSIVITGTGFTGATAVKFGATNATTYTVNSATQITATAAAGTGIVDLTVTVPVGGTSATSAADKYTYVALPVVTGLSPTAGLTTGGASVVVTGANFTGATAVKFGATNATTYTVNSATQITATAPAGTGVVDLTVTVPIGGTSTTSSADQFTYVAVPTVTGLSPSAGPVAGGASVVITGTGFSGATAVKFGATNATTYTVNSATQITATAPAGTGVVDVTVAVPVGGTSATSSADKFTYLAVPTVTQVTPFNGPSTGGTSVLITGTGFTGATAVKFGAANAASYVVNADYEIRATSPPGFGGVSVTVTTPGGISANSSSNGFSYAVTPPTISIDSPTLTEGNSGTSNFNFTVTRSGDDVLSNVTVAYNTSDNSPATGAATAGSDYTATSGTVTFPSGATTATISVPVSGDTNVEANEQFFVNLTSITNVTGPAVTLSAKTDFTTLDHPHSVAIGDLNGDSKPDLVVADWADGYVSVFLNTTSPGATVPTYATKVEFATGFRPSLVTIGDLNGDGKADLAIANESSISVLLNTTAAGATTPTFAAKTDFVTGGKSLAIGDLNGDGKPDFATLNPGFVSVMLNTTATGASTPSFASKVDFAVGSSPYAVAISDLNGDGKLDLAVVNRAIYSTVSVLLNTTTTGASVPSFAAKTDFSVGLNAFSLAIGDLNGDGKPDLATANPGSNSVSVLLNTTTPGASVPTYAAKIDFDTGTSPSPSSIPVLVAIRDVNGDGKLDLATANSASNNISLLLNATPTGASTPTFSAHTDFSTGIQPYSLAIGDLNGDGKPDFAVANNNTATGTFSVSVLLNTTVLPTITAAFAPKTDFTASSPKSLAIGDVNGDGKPDLATANSNKVSVLLNTTSPGASVPAYAAKTDFTSAYATNFVAMRDLNGDGKPDLAVTSNDPTNCVSVLLNTTAPGASTPTYAARVDFGVGTGPLMVGIGDFNDDGKPDLATVNFYSATVSVLLNTTTPGATTPTYATAANFATGASPRAFAIGDFNGDGKLDLAVANTGSTTVSILLNTTVPGASTPSFAAAVDFAIGLPPGSIAIGDLNGDGKPDLAVSNYTNGSPYTAGVSILLNTTAAGATSPSFAAKVDNLTGEFPGQVAMGDLNGDGKLDFAVTGTRGEVLVYLNETTPGAASPAFASPIRSATGPSTLSVAIGDFNGDGRLDLAAASSNNVSVLLNRPVTISVSQGTGTIVNDDFAPPTVTGLSLTSGPKVGGTSVIITGTGFSGATAVKFGATNATTYTVNSATQITATAPAGTGIVDVTVTIPLGGTSATSAADQFTYVVPTATFVSDINLASTGSSPAQATAVGAITYFTATDGATGGHGRELWKTDGTAAGTVLVKDVNPGSGNSNPSNLTNVNGTLYFSASSDGVTSGLWKSDGTAAGTVVVSSVDPRHLANVNGTLFFADTQKLWKIDFQGNAVLVKDFGVSNLNSQFVFMSYNNQLFFTMDDGVTGLELWKSDGTLSGTVLVKDVNPGSGGSTPDFGTVAGSTLYFRAYDDNHGFELWKSDGTTAGTLLVKDVNPGTASALNNPFSGITAVGNLVYLSANDGTNGTDTAELWRSDGTDAGTVMVAALPSGPGGSYLSNLTNVNSVLYFSTPTNGSFQLYKSDGTAGGTDYIHLPSVFFGLQLSNFMNFNGTLLFGARDFLTSSDQQLWRSDGTPGGTFSLQNSTSTIDLFGGVVNANGTAFFAGSDPYHGMEIWKSNGTIAGTIQVKDIDTDSLNSNPSGLANANGLLLFSANDGINGRELWKSNGAAGGTALVKDINPSNSYPFGFTTVNGTTYFVANDGTHGSELWKTDGTPAGTSLAADIIAGSTGSGPNNLTNVSGTLYFTANDGSHGVELWKFDGTTASMVADVIVGATSSSPAELTNVNGVLYFRDVGFRLWTSNGTSAGTIRLSPAGTGYANGLTNVNGKLFFSNQDANGQELWTTDGTVAGTTMVLDVFPGSSSALPIHATQKPIAAVGNIAFFQANDGTHGTELWKSDGTAAGTVLVKDIHSGSGRSYLYSMTNVGGVLYFVANDGTTGYELWRSDGTTAGTTLVKDVNPDQSGGRPSGLTNVNGVLYFSAYDGTNVRSHLWTSDGTTAGTTLVPSFSPTDVPLDVTYLTNVNGSLFFTALDDQHGVELWSVPTQSPTVTSLSPASGATAGGATVTIVGTNFTGATAVKFGATNATTFTVNSASQITATAPAGTGVVDVTVSIPVLGTSATSAADQFTYNVATSTTVSSAPGSPVTQGTSTTFSASITGSPSVGTVTFFDGATQIGSPGTVVNGAATSSATTSLTVGTHSITAVYSGGTGFAGSSSSALSFTVNPASVITTFSGGQLTIDYVASSVAATVTNASGSISLSGAVVGGAGAGPFTGVTSIVVTDSGNLAGQSLTFAGTAFTLTGGLNATGVETVTFNQSINASGGTSALSVDTPAAIVVNAGLTGGSGGISLTANSSGTSSTSSIGIDIGAVVNSGSGPLTVVGKGGSSGTSSNFGVYVHGSGMLTSNGGTVQVNGTGGGAGAAHDSHGVYVNTGGQISAGGSGAVIVIGYGAPNVTGTNNYGVAITGSTSQITSGGGNVSVTGTGGGTSASEFNVGVSVTSGGKIASGSSGTVTVRGDGGLGSTASSEYGVFIGGTNAQITTGGGAIDVTGYSNKYGVWLEQSGAIVSSGSASVSVKADYLTIASPAVINGLTNNVTLTTQTAGTPIDVGGSSNLSPLKLGLSDTLLDRVTAGTLNLGSSASGAMTVSADITRPASTNTSLVSGGDIVVSGGSVNTNGGTLTFSSGATNAVKPTKTGVDATTSAVNPVGFTSGGRLAIDIAGATVDAQYSQLNVSGAVDLTGVDLVLTGAYVPASGDFFTIVSASSRTGTFNGLPPGASIVFNGQTLRIGYTATGVVLDGTPPTAGTVNDGLSADIAFQASVTTISANWSGFSDSGSGIASYQWAIGTTPGGTQVQAFTSTGISGTSATASSLSLTSGTTYYVSVKAIDNVGNASNSATSNGVTVDSVAPTVGTVNDGLGADIAYQSSTNTISANWSGFSDSGSGIAGYQWAIGTTPGGTQVQGFTSAGITGTTAAAGSLSLSRGTTYYVSVKAIDQVGNTSNAANSNGVIVVGAPSLGTSSLLEGPAAGSDSDIVVCGDAWTATANASWLHTSASGTGSGLVSFTFDANSGATRTGTLSIAGLTLTVTQAGIGYVPANLATLVPGVLANPYGVAVDGSGNVYFADALNNAIKKWSASTQTITTLVSSGLNNPHGVAVDASGNVYIADYLNFAIKEWHASTQTVTTLVTSGLYYPNGVAVDGSGNVFIADTGNNAIKEWHASTQTVTTLISSGLNGPSGVAVDGSGNVYIADSGNSAIKEWNGSSQTITTLVSASYPKAIALDGAGNVYYDDDSQIKEWAVSTQMVAPLTPAYQLYNQSGVAVDGSGNVYIADTNNNKIKKWSASTQALATLVSSELYRPRGMVVDGSGNVYIADSLNRAIKEWHASTEIITTPVSFPLYEPYGVAMDGSGSLYIADPNINAIEKWNASTQTVSTLISSGLANPNGVAVDRSGDLYIADTGNNAIKKWNATTQTISTLVSSGLNQPSGVTVDSSGNVYIADTLNHSIEKWNASTQTVTSIVSAGLDYPVGVAVDGSGNLYIADFGSNAIKKWNASTQTVTTLALVSSGGAQTPFGVAVDASGNVYIADTPHNAFDELPRAYVAGGSFSEPAAAGGDQLQPILPATQSLTGAFAPTSDQTWLTIGGVANGIVSFSFTQNTGAARTGHLTVLGQQITVTQNAAPTPAVTGLSPTNGPPSGGTSVIITGANFTGATAVKFGGTNAASFTIDSATQITAISPVGTGIVDVTVVTVAGASATSSADQFTYVVSTATTVTASPVGPVTQQTPVTFTATVLGSPSVGTVTFYAGPGLTNPIGSAVNVGSGSAMSAATTTLPVGTNTITAVYSGGSGFAGSLGTTSFVVGANSAPTVAITGPTEGTVTSNRRPTFSATASDNSGTGLASVQFQYSVNGGSSWTNLGPALLSAPFTYTPTADLPTGTLAARAVATDNVGNQSAGTYALSAIASFLGSAANPSATLVRDAQGNLFGTTKGGGDFGLGTVFKVTSAGVFSTLASFDGSNGANPEGDRSLVLDASGNLFGVAQAGGASGNGTVFKIAAGTSTISVIASFTGANGSLPNSLAIDATGNLFGTTISGGASDLGTVYKISAGASTITTLVSFVSGTSGNGYLPGDILVDSSGNLFGTAYYGGASNNGTVFKIAAGTNAISTLVSFNSTNGANPVGLTSDTSGNLFGVTINGGASAKGAVFKIASGTNAFSSVASFNGTNGQTPNAGLVFDGNGNLFGTTNQGGSGGVGSVFEIASGASTITTVASFASGGGPNQPNAGLIVDASGNLYGTTQFGGPQGSGSVFKIDSGTSTVTALAYFPYTAGNSPWGALTRDASGDLFGTTVSGGANNQGTVYEIAAGTNVITTIATFNGANGARPYAGLTQDAAGNFYGTTVGGGASGQGTVFKIDAGTNTIITIASFNGTNGSAPFTDVSLDASGNIYGVTDSGGSSNNGTVFKIAAGTNTITTIASFNGSGNGSHPRGKLTFDASGNLFGTTQLGGSAGDGTVFKIASGSSTITTLMTFTGTNGNQPYGGLIFDASGNLYGTTIAGGASGYGTVYKLAAGTYAFTSLVSLSPTTGGGPYGSLLLDAAGNLFGTASTGKVFEIAAGTTTATPIASLNYANGNSPYSALILDPSGTLYGTSVHGGSTGSGTAYKISTFNSFTIASTTTTSVWSTPDSPILQGTSTTFTATVTGSPSVGAVTFYAGPGLTNQIGSAVSVANGSATSFATSSLAVGSYTITAVYSGGTGFAGSLGTTSVVVVAPPTVTSVTGFIGPTSGGNNVVIVGTNFTGATAVTFGTVSATNFTVNSATQITATAPAGSGTVNVTVTNAAGTSNTAATGDDYTYATPAVTSVVVNGSLIQTLTGATWTSGNASITVTSTAGLVAGSLLSSLGSGFPTNGVVVSVDSPTTLTLNSAPTATQSTATIIQSTNAPKKSGTALTLTGATWTSGSTTVTVASTANLVVGQYLDSTAAGLPNDVVVASIPNGTTFTLSSAATATQPTPTTLRVANGSVARNRNGTLLDLSGQNSVVDHLVVTFNQPVRLDANADGSTQAFNLASLAGSMSALGAAPAAAGVTLTAAGVTGTGNATDGYTQYILNFVAGASVNSFSNATSGGLGNAFSTLANGVFQLNTVSSKIHAGTADLADARTPDTLWSLYGAVNVDDVKITGAAGGGNDTVLVDGLALNDIYHTFGSFATGTTPPYSLPYDRDLDGDVDGADLNKLYANFGSIWKF